MSGTASDSERISHYVEAFPETFAGRWLEIGSLRSEVVAFTDSPHEHMEALRSLAHEPNQIRVIQVRYSWQHLTNLSDRIVSILGSAEGLTTWGPDVKANRVAVAALPERIDEIRRILTESNPDDVLVEPGTPWKT